MKKILALLLAVLMIVGLAACNSGSKDEATKAPATETQAPTATEAPEAPEEEEHEPVTLTLSCMFPSGNPFEANILNPLQAALDEATGGLVTIDYYPAGTLTAPDETLEGIIQGVADIGLVTVAYATGRLPITFMVEYPVRYNSARASSNTMKELIEIMDPPEWDDVMMLMPWCTGEGLFITNGKQIHTIDDLPGLELRANAIIGKAVGAWGGTPVTMTSGEAYEAMRSGVVDGYIGATESVTNLKFYEVGEYATQIPVFNASFALCMNNDSFSALPAAWQDAIVAAMDQIFEDNCDYIEVNGEAAYKVYQEMGSDVVIMDEAEIKRFEEASSGLLGGYAAELDGKGLPGTEAMNTLLELAEKYNEMYPVSQNPWFHK